MARGAVATEKMTQLKRISAFGPRSLASVPCSVRSIGLRGVGLDAIEALLTTLPEESVLRKAERRVMERHGYDARIIEIFVKADGPTTRSRMRRPPR